MSFGGIFAEAIKTAAKVWPKPAVTLIMVQLVSVLSK